MRLKTPFAEVSAVNRKEYNRMYRLFRNYDRTPQRRVYLEKNKAARSKKVNLWKKKNREATRSHQHKYLVQAYGRLADSEVRKYLKRTLKRTPTEQEIEQCRQRIQNKRAARILKLLAAATELSRASKT